MIGIVVRNTLVMYDREHSRIGFWKTNCSELWERLHKSGAPPLTPSAPNRENSSTTPTLAPSQVPHYVLPGMENCRPPIIFNIEFGSLS